MTSSLERRGQGGEGANELQIFTHIHRPIQPNASLAILPLGLFRLYSTEQPKQSHEAEACDALRDGVVEVIDLLSQQHALFDMLRQHVGREGQISDQWPKEWCGQLQIAAKAITETLRVLRKRAEAHAIAQDPYVLVRMMPVD